MSPGTVSASRGPRGSSHGPAEILLVEVGRQRYGLRSSSVKEVLRCTTIVPLPRAPAIVEGLVDIRGSVTPVLDLRARFRLPPRAPDSTDHLVVAMAGDRTVAVRVDSAVGLVRLDSAQIAVLEDVVVGTRYVAGVARLEDGLVLIHDLTSFLSQAEGSALDAALGETPPVGGSP